MQVHHRTESDQRLLTHLITINVYRSTNIYSITDSCQEGSGKPYDRSSVFVTHLDFPAVPARLLQLCEPLVDVLDLYWDHVPEPGEVLTARHEGVLVAGHVLKEARGGVDKEKSARRKLQEKTSGQSANSCHQSWALGVFFNLFNNEKWLFCIFYQVNLTGGRHFK